MRRQTPIAQQLYNYLFPIPTSTDPQSFSVHLARNLVPEVRIEVATFYGDLSSTEARYPGLNYCHTPHRMRLGRFDHHKALFDAFDDLGLTYNEIQEFCCWEGTKWARERYERDEGIKVYDTTGDEIGPFVDRRELRDAEEHDAAHRRSITRKTEISVIVEDTEGRGRMQPSTAEDEDEEMSQVESEDAEDSVLDPSEMGYAYDAPSTRHFSISQAVLAAWQQGHSLPPDIEQYLKEASERGALGDLQPTIRDHVSSVHLRRPTSTTTSQNTANVAPRAAA